MLITNKTVISFRIPEECQLLEWFRAQHPDLIELVTSQYVGLMMQETYSVEMREDSECKN